MSALGAALVWVAGLIVLLLVGFKRTISWLWVGFKWIMMSLLAFAAAFVLIMIVGNVVFATKRNEPHRNLHPQHADCHNPDGWKVLAELQNDELLAMRTDPSWRRKFKCAIQTHVVPATDGGKSGRPDLKFHLAFLEFQEDGRPQTLEGRPANSTALSQYALLQKHLDDPQRKSNVVIAFIHGWRHDSKLGNDNVSDLRHYAAHTARFLADRCIAEGRFCGTEVTAIYVGWRGARVDEVKIKETFGHRIGGLLAGATMWITLFDRKPISEEVGPAAITALRGLDRILDKKKSQSASPVLPAGAASNEQRMIVIGHSLGGNMLMTGLKDQLIKNVIRHEPTKFFESPIGDLVVLLNPASEAAHWTAIQRTVWNRIAFRTSEVRADSTLEHGHRLFERNQPPVLISVTAARSWPPSEIWPQDCDWLRLPIEDTEDTEEARAKAKAKAQAKARILSLIADNRGIYAADVNYDWATYDLFPLFKFDFRPIATTVQRIADRIAARATVESGSCPTPGIKPPSGFVSYFWKTMAWPVGFLASVLRNTPFMNTDREHTHTIGHLNPPRPSTDTLAERSTLPFKPFGTTHELIGAGDRDSEKPAYYRDIASGAYAACPSAPHWLWRARTKQAPFGSQWDSNELVPLADGNSAKPAAHIVHSYVNAGMLPITRANDPFWNIRAFDNALSEHGGYMLSSFICAIHQFVLDDVASAPRAPQQ